MPANYTGKYKTHKESLKWIKHTKRRSTSGKDKKSQQKIRVNNQGKHKSEGKLQVYTVISATTKNISKDHEQEPIV